MRRHRFRLAAAAAAALVTTAGLLGPGGGAAPAAPSGPDQRVIVELSGKPAIAAAPTRAFAAAGRAKVDSARGKLAADHRAFLSRARKAGVAVHDQRSLTLLDNAIALRVPASEVATLRTLPGVTAVLPDVRAHASTDTSVPLVGAPQVWQQHDAQGRPERGTGVTVAIVDTGVDYTHPDLGGGFGPGHKVVAGYDFANDDADPADDNGHGTHVAGIVAGSAAKPGGVTGVAPDATLTAYKVLDDGGSGWTSDIIAGIEAAVDPANEHRADVVNLSLGAPGDGTDPLGQAASAAVAAGVVVVAAAGNDGPGAGTLSSPGDAPGVLAVGASTSGVRLPAATLTAPKHEPLQVQRSPLSANPPAEPVTAPVVDVGAGTDADYERVGDVRGKIVLRSWRVPPSADHISSADIAAARADEKRGALAVIGYEQGSSGPQLAPRSATVDLPAHGLDSGDSLRMDKLVVLGMDDSQYAELGRIGGTDSLRITISGTDVTDTMASFSSRGPTAAFGLKPDLVAPGVEIRSTVPTSLYGPGEYRMSGTSMAAPHVAGAAALLRQAHPDRSAAAIAAALVGTAHGLADVDPTVQGAGRLDVARAAAANVTAQPSSLSMGLADLSGDTVRGSATLTLHNDGSTAATTTLRSAAADGTPGTATVSPERVSVPAGGTATVTVTVSAKRDLSADTNVSGWVTAAPAGGPALRVPYLLAERPLVVRAAPDPSDGTSTVFVYSPTPLNGAPQVRVAGRHGRPVTVTARRDHDEWYRADVHLTRAGAYQVGVTGWATGGQRLAGAGALEVTARNQAAKWQPVGPNSTAWHLTTTPANERMGVLLEWTSPAPWITTDRGATWTRAGRLPVAAGGDGQVVVDPRRSSRLYLAVNGASGQTLRTVFDPTYQGKILRTDDRGRTWTTLDFPDTEVHSLVADADGGTLAAVTDTGVLISHDHGDSWRTEPVAWGDAPQWAAVSGHDLYVGTLRRIVKVAGFDAAQPAPATVVREVYDESSRTFVSGLVADGTAVVYADDDGVVYSSTDGGASWTKKFALPSSYPSGLSLVDGTIWLAALGEVDYLGADHGATWTTMPRPNRGPVDTDADAWPGDDALLVSQENGGLYTTSDHGASYRRIGVPGAEVSDLAVADDGDGAPHLLAGAPGADTYSTPLPTGRIDAGTAEWGPAQEGYNYSAPHYGVSPKRPGLAWKSLGYPAVDSYELQTSTDGGRTWIRADRTNGVAYAVLASPADPDRVVVSMKSYAHGYGLRVTADGGHTWKNLYHPRAYTAIAGDPRDADRLWLGAADGLYRSDDGGVTAVKVAGGSVGSILVTGSRIVVGGSSIRVSTDGGKHFATADTGGLPMRVSDLYAPPGAGHTLYAATTSYATNGLPQGGRGVLRSTDNGRTWHNVSGGLRSTAVTSLAGSPDGRWLFAGTADGGVHRLRLHG